MDTLDDDIVLYLWSCTLRHRSERADMGHARLGFEGKIRLTTTTTTTRGNGFIYTVYKRAHNILAGTTCFGVACAVDSLW